MSDYKDYAVTVKYEGEIYISALDKEEALEMAKATMLEETNFTMEKWLTYEVEE